MISLNEIQIEKCRSEIPALSNKSYFNFGGQGTVPQTALDAIETSFRYVQHRGPFSAAMFQWIRKELQQTRESLAVEFGGEPCCYALTQNVTEGCNIAVWGQEWERGDRLITTDSEHSGVVNLLETLARRRGVELLRLPVLNREHNDILEDLQALLKQKPKLMVASHVFWNSGDLLPVRQISDLCHAHGTRVLIDGAQSAGAMPLDVVELDVDYYAFTGHKWLCGPEGVGALYVKESELAVLQPTFVGWRVELGMSEQAHASRFEVATTSFPLLAGFRDALQFHKRWGSADTRYQAIRELASYFKSKLESSGKAQLILKGELQSGLVSFVMPGQSHQAVVGAFEESGVIFRSIPFPDCIRTSIHYFSEQSELDRLVAALPG